MMKIVTALLVHNFHLFISYLGNGVEIIEFEDLRYKFRLIRKDYKKVLGLKNSIQEITTYGSQLFGVLDSTVNSFSLEQTTPQFQGQILPELKTSQISIDYFFNDLYLLSEEKGINEIDIKNPLKPRFNKQIIPKTFEKIGDPSISNMISDKRFILLSYRGFGASLIINNPIGAPNEIVYRTEDAQDVRYSEKLDLVIVADAFDGLIFFNSKIEAAEKKVKLIDNDFPQEIKLFLGNILIKGKNGLYIYYLKDGELRKIWEGPVGAFTTYYNYIFFSSKSQIHLLIESDNTISQFKLLEPERIDLKINKYSH
jgi:hypothetical protein